MTTLQDLLFPVFLCDNPKRTNSEYSKIVKAKINNEVWHLNYCSPIFNVLKNRDVFPVIENMLERAGCGFVKAYNMNDEKTNFNASYIIKEKNGVDVGIAVGGVRTDDDGNDISDKIYPTALVDNSYNGKSNGSLTFGYFRMICSNGLIIPLEGKEESNFMIKGKHTPKLSFSFEQLLSKINLFLDTQEKMQKKFEVLTDRAVPTYEERILEVLVATDIATSDDQFRNIANVIAKESKELGTKVNDFLIYNGINGHIFKGENGLGNKSKALPEVKRKLDKKVFSYMVANESIN